MGNVDLPIGLGKSTYPSEGWCSKTPGFSERRTFFLDLGLNGTVITRSKGPPVFLNTVSPQGLVGRQLFVGGGHPGHKIFGPADTPLRTRFRADGRKSFLARTCK